jgi:inosine-uridine nucleoside N-ribohydrolase
MRRLFVWMTLLITFCAADVQAAEPLATRQRLPLIVDTDLGFDDCSAVLYLLNRADVEILAVTVAGMGEAHCRPGVENVSRLCKLAGRYPPAFPVACGDEEPSDGYQTFPARWRNDADTFFGQDIAVPPRHSDKRMKTGTGSATGRTVAEGETSSVAVPVPVFIRSTAHAVDVIIDVLKSANRPVTLLTLGPLSNIAAVFERAPWVKSKLARLYVMGGAVNVGGNIRVPGVTDHLQNRVAEWNIYIDPVAARAVFRAGVPISLVSLDGTQHIPITEDRVRQFARDAKTPEAKFIVRWCERERAGIHAGVYCWWDTLAAMAAVESDICRYTTYKLDVVVAYAQGVPRGDLPAFSPLCRSGRPRRAFDEATVGQTKRADDGVPIAVCTDADAAKFWDRYLRVLNREAPTH